MVFPLITPIFAQSSNVNENNSIVNSTTELPYSSFVKSLAGLNRTSNPNTFMPSNVNANTTAYYILPMFHGTLHAPENSNVFPPLPVAPSLHSIQGSQEITPSGLTSTDTPQEVWSAYNLNNLSCSMTGYQWGDPHLCGYGEVIAIVDAYNNPNIVSDLAEFDTVEGLPSCAPNQCFFEFSYGGTPQIPTGSNEIWISEIDADVELIHSIAPGAAIALVETVNSLQNTLDGASLAIAQSSNHVNQVSMSWGGSEFLGETSDDQNFNVSGVSFIASSGDVGHFVQYPAASPYVVGVGGTILSFDGLGNFQNEVAWSLGNYNNGAIMNKGSSGGISQYETEPSFQSNYGISSNGMRGVPDVSADALNLLIYDSYDGFGFTWFAGTSASAPIWSAIIADANSEHPSNPLSSSSFGTLNAIYNAAIGRPYEQNFRDITSGQNGNCGICNAGPGYDFVTGLGSPKVNNLLPFLSPNAASATSIPQNLVVSTSNNQISLSWQTPASNGGSAIQDFNIYRGTSSGGETQFISVPASQTSYVDTTATDGVTYYYYVTAVNSVGESSNSNEVSAAIYCLPPNSGDWTISQNCLLSSSVTAPANVIVQSGSVLTIPNGDALNMDFYHHHLLVKSGSGVLIKAGGVISQIEPTAVSVTISNGASLTGGTCSATNCFDPNAVIISTGGTVTWINDDSVGHTATSGKPTDNSTGTIFDSTLINPGHTYISPAFNTVGTYNYFCQVHPWMTGEITVR